MSLFRTLPLAASLAIAVAVGGCSSGPGPGLPDTVAELRDIAVQGQARAESARQEKSPQLAAGAADRAEAAAAKAGELVAAMAEPTAADRSAQQEAAAAARKARRFAKLADEDRRLDDLVNGWKAKTYRTARQVAWPGACQGLALAAEQAGKTEPEALPESVRSTANLGADLVRQFAPRRAGGVSPLIAPGTKSDDQGADAPRSPATDWPVVASDLRNVATSPPPELMHAMAAAYLLAGRKEFALYEIEMVDTAALRTGEQRYRHQLLRGFTLSSNGLPLLGSEEVEKTAVPNAQDSNYGPALLAGMHLLAAYVHLDAKDYEQADRELVRAIQVWPNDPIAVFLTGERLAADGQYEKAAGSLEELARNTEAKWLADKVAQRARDLRDKPAESQTLLHDDAFVREVILHLLANAAKNSAPAKRLNDAITTTQSFAKKLLELIPGG